MSDPDIDGVIAGLRSRVRDQNHDLGRYERGEATIVRLRRQRRELARIATEAIDMLERATPSPQPGGKA